MTERVHPQVGAVIRALRGYYARSDDVSVLIFATSASQAKMLALRSEWFSEIEFMELRVRREPRIDFAAERYGSGYLDLDTPDQVALARSLGWSEIDGGDEPCEVCGLYPWSLGQLLPISELNEAGVCGECASAP